MHMPSSSGATSSNQLERVLCTPHFRVNFR